MKINAITLIRLRNDANFQFHTEFKELAEKLTPEALKIKPLFEAYLPLYEKVDLALKKIVKSAITEQIQDADKARDNIWMNKTKFISLTASLLLAITLTLSCEDKETKDKPVPAAVTAETVAAGSGGGSKIMYVNDVKGLNMRSEPSTDGVKLGTLFYGTKVKVLEKSSTPVKIGDITDYWYKIDAKAWVFGGYLSEKPPKEGTLTDSRDGKVYRKVKIGKQTWMAENLNYEAAGSCYDDKPENCEKYGSLYGRNFSDCPAGWHLPSKEEYEVLIKTVPGDAGKKLKAKSGWNDDDGKPINGTDDFGFSALPGGDGSGGWWTASSDGYCSDGTCFELPYYLEFSKHDSWRFDFDYNVIGGSSAMFSVRCIQD